jgi:hypothetical protein
MTYRTKHTSLTIALALVVTNACSRVAKDANATGRTGASTQVAVEAPQVGGRAVSSPTRGTAASSAEVIAAPGRPGANHMGRILILNTIDYRTKNAEYRTPESFRKDLEGRYVGATGRSRFINARQRFSRWHGHP